MASSNKVVLLQSTAFGAAPVRVRVFDNRKVLTTFLSNNVKLTDPENGETFEDDGALLRDAVDLSFQDGTPLRYNSSFTVVKWISGTVEEQNVVVRTVLRYSGPLDDVEFDTFAPTDILSKATLAEAFKMKEEKVERARIVSSMKPFGKAAQAGFLPGDLLLQQVKNKTTLFLASEKKPLALDVKGSNEGLIYVARAMTSTGKKTTTTTTTLASKIPAYREPSTDFATDVEDNEEDDVEAAEKISKKTAKKKTATRTVKSRTTTATKKKSDTNKKIDDESKTKTPEKSRAADPTKKSTSNSKKKIGEKKTTETDGGAANLLLNLKSNSEGKKSRFLEAKQGGPHERFGWSSHTKAPPNHVFGTQAKRSSYQLSTRSTRSTRRTAAGNKTQEEIASELSATAAELGGLRIADENSNPNSKDQTESASQKRIAELEAEVANLQAENAALKKQLAEQMEDSHLTI